MVMSINYQTTHALKCIYLILQAEDLIFNILWLTAAVYHQQLPTVG